MPPLAYALLFVAGFGGGFIDAVAGGGGLITVPALLATGMPPQMALGTNKLQSSFGTSIAVWHYARAGLMRTPALGLAAALAFFASMAGAHAVSVLHKDLLKQLIPWLLAAARRVPSLLRATAKIRPGIAGYARTRLLSSPMRRSTTRWSM